MRGQDEEAVGAMISKKLADPGFAFHPVHPGSNHLFKQDELDGGKRYSSWPIGWVTHGES